MMSWLFVCLLGVNFQDSRVLANQGPSVRQNLLHLIKSVTGRGYWDKCYTASKHAFSAPKFHERCDNRGPTLTIVRVGSHIFGGYTDISWNGKIFKF